MNIQSSSNARCTIAFFLERRDPDATIETTSLHCGLVVVAVAVGDVEGE